MFRKPARSFLSTRLRSALRTSILLSVLLLASGASAAPLTLVNDWTVAPGAGAPEAFLKSGIVRLRGAISGGTTGLFTTLPVELRPNVNVYVTASLCNSTPGRIVITPAGTVVVQFTGAFADAQCRTSLDGVAFSLDGTSFTPMTLLNGWTNGVFGTAPVAAHIVDGVVHFRGAVTDGTNATLFVLPPQFRPAADVYMPTNLCNGAAGRVVAQPSGVVAVFASSGLPSEAECFTSLEGLSFPVTATTWTSLALENGWTGGPFATNAPRARWIDGTVHLAGAVSSGSTAVIATLPPELRPTHTTFVPADLCNGVRGTLQVEPSGAISVQTAAPFANPQCFTSLESVKFLVDSGFVDLTLLNGWVGGPFGTAQPGAVARTRIVHLRGAVASGSVGLITTLPPLLRPAADTYVLVDLCGGALGRLYIQPNGNLSVQSATTFAVAQCFTSLDGVTFPSASAGIAFTPLTLTSGWTGGAFGADQPSVASIDGLVHLKGAASGGTTNTMFTLPAAYRPAADVYAPISLCNSEKGRLYVSATGIVQVFAASSFADAQCFTSLDGVKFATSSAGYSSLATQNGWFGPAFGSFPLRGAVRDGMAFLQGAVGGGTTDTVAILPPLLRPTTDVYLPIDLCNGAKGRAVIQPSGDLRVFTLSGSFAEAQCFSSLEGIAYPVPEPAGAAGLLAGLALLGALRRGAGRPALPGA